MSEESLEWAYVPVQTIAREIAGGGTPSREVPNFWDGGIPWVTPGELTNLREKYLGQTVDTISKSGLTNSGARLLPPGSLVVTTRATLGLVAMAASEITTNQGFRSIVLKGDADPGFYYHLFRTLKPELERRASGTTFLEISGKEFRRIVVPLPSLREQRRIAEILDALDEQIRTTEQIISKLETMRTGLTHDLLRVGSDGDWKPDGWIVQPLGEVIAGIDAGKSPDCPNRSAGAGRWGVLKVSAVGAHGFLEEENKEIPVSVPVDRQNEVHSGDVLMTRANTPELVGMVCIVRKQPSARLVLSDKIWRIKPGPMIGAGFLVEALRCPPTRRFIQSQATGTSGSMKNIPKTAACKIRLPVPSLSEQRKIAAILAAEREREDSERAKAAGLRALKQGLMADLLTGRVRVPTESAS